MFIRSVLLFLLVVLGPCSFAQVDLQGETSGMDVIIHGRNKASEAGELLFQAVWRGVSSSDPSFTFQRMSAAADEEALMLDRLIETALGTYLDQRIHFSKQGVKADLPAPRLVLEMEAIVHAANRS